MRCLTAVIIGICGALALPVGAATFYVDLNATAGGTGGAADPFQTIGAGVAAINAEPLGTHFLLIADGTYKPIAGGGLENFGTEGYTFGNPSGGGSFHRIHVDGGYAGGGDWVTRVPRSTIIDLDQANTRAFQTVDARTVLYVDGLTIRNGNVTGNGGALLLGSGFAAEVNAYDCLFEDNTAAANGGAISTGYRSDVEDCEFMGNTSQSGGGDNGGGALYIVGSGGNYGTVLRCEFVANSAVSKGGAVLVSNSTGNPGVDMFDTLLSLNSASVGGAVGTIKPALMTRCVVRNNSATTAGGGLGSAGFQGGGFVLLNCQVTDNTSPNYAIITGGNQPGNISVNFCTVANNTGGGISAIAGASNKEADFVCRNNIIANNGAEGIRTEDTTPDIDYNNIYGHTTNYVSLTPGANDVGGDPGFFNAGGGDYRLSSTSPGVDSADPASTLSDDLNGNARPDGAFSDMGAFEGVVCITCAEVPSTVLNDLCLQIGSNPATSEQDLIAALVQLLGDFGDICEGADACAISLLGL